AYGSTAIARTTNRGTSWTKLRGPVRKRGRKLVALALRDLEMTSANAGYALDTSGRVWRTRNGGRRWSELPGVGTDDGLALAFGSATAGYLTLRNYPADNGASYVLRTPDPRPHPRPHR